MVSIAAIWWRAALVISISGIAIAACIPSPSIQQHAFTSEPTVSTVQFLQFLPLGLEVLLPVPANNPLTQEKTDLGRALFFDRRLSLDESISCATCHLPDKAFTDGLAVSVGINNQPGRRNAPSLLNSAYLRSMFRDGHLESLEQQALEPMINPVELGNTHEEIVRRLSADKIYPLQFERAFGSKKITIEFIAKAIASFERTLLSGDSDFDRYVISKDPNALSAAALRGLELFRGKANCQLCHEHVLLTDDRFHNTGVSWGKQPLDLGRYEITNLTTDMGKFRTPSLRDVEHTAPYMHDGSMKTLGEVLEFYNDGGVSNSYLNPAIKSLNLSSRDQADIIAFLNSLSGSNWQEEYD